jgi:cyclic beta-1,2-glucan synthetase
VLAPLAADVAHPAFSKLFVVTDFLPELGVLIATRRRRAPTSPRSGPRISPWSKAREARRCRSRPTARGSSDRAAASAEAAMAGAPLSQTTGTVLDPVFAIRRSVVVPRAGGRA